MIGLLSDIEHLISKPTLTNNTNRYNTNNDNHINETNNKQTNIFINRIIIIVIVTLTT